ncbi:hydrolase [Nocardia camponoti]|uniref:Hydrolase n=2 Tax=Nocardia camponoti TaxID=1616106 RepID=A0A917QAM8_9NOCA|nr:hydrolase [Nocardia camponoti]
MFATDLDGTLLRSDGTISPRTAAAMAAAREAGVEVVWATARARHSVRALAATCGFRGKAVCANGAVIVDLATGEPEIVETVTIDADHARTAMAHLRELVPGVAFANVGATEFVAEAEYVAMCDFTDHHRHPHDMTVSTVLPVANHPLVKIVARHADVPSADLFTLVSGAGIAGVEVTHSGAPYVEMAAAGVSKASALERVCQRLGIDATEVAAAGDAFNDVAMLTWAGTAVVPANARPEVRALAALVIPANDEDGVAQYLEQLIAEQAASRT